MFQLTDSGATHTELWARAVGTGGEVPPALKTVAHGAAGEA